MNLAAVFIVMPILFLLVLRVIATLSGWDALAKHYRCTETPHGQQFLFQTVRIGIVYFSSCLRVIACDAGLYLHPMFVFKIFHPPLLIPWGEFHNAKLVRDLWMIFSRKILISVGKPEVCTIILNQKLWKLRPNN